MRASDASTTSTGETLRSRTRAAISVAGRKFRSAMQVRIRSGAYEREGNGSGVLEARDGRQTEEVTADVLEVGDMHV